MWGTVRKPSKSNRTKPSKPRRTFRWIPSSMGGLRSRETSTGSSSRRRPASASCWTAPLNASTPSYGPCWKCMTPAASAWPPIEAHRYRSSSILVPRRRTYVVKVFDLGPGSPAHFAGRHRHVRAWSSPFVRGDGKRRRSNCTVGTLPAHGDQGVSLTACRDHATGSGSTRTVPLRLRPTQLTLDIRVPLPGVTRSCWLSMPGRQRLRQPHAGPCPGNHCSWRGLRSANEATNGTGTRCAPGEGRFSGSSRSARGSVPPSISTCECSTRTERTSC